MQDLQRKNEELLEEIISLQRRINELEQSEKQSRHLASFPYLTPVMILEVDKKKHVVFCNPAMQFVLDIMKTDDPCVFIPDDIWELFSNSDALAKNTYTREVVVNNSSFIEHIFFTPEFDSLRIYATDITENKKIDEKLKKQGDMFNLFFNAVHESMILIDTKGIVLLCNEVVAERLGRAVSELVGSYIYDCFPPEVADCRKHYYDLVVETGESVHFEDVRLGRTFEHYCYPVFDNNKKVTGVTVFARETTLQKHAQDALLAEKKLSDSLLNSTPGIFYCFDNQLRYKRWNKNLEHVTGYSPEELLKISPLELFEGEGRKLVEHRIREAFTKGETTAEADIISKDGRKTPYFFTGKRVIIDNADCIIGMGVDITERKQLEQSLLRSKSLLAETQKISKIGGWEYDVDTGKTTWTDEVYRIYGISKDYDPNNIYKDIEFYAPQDRNAIEHAFQMAVHQGVSYELELQFISAEGLKLWVRTIGKPVIHNGKTIKVVGYIMDITEYKKTEQHLQESEERYRTIFDNTGTAMLIIEEDTTISLVNDEMLKLVGYTREYLELKRSWTEFVANEDLERMKEYHALRRIKPEEAPKNYEFRLIDSFRNTHNVLLTISLIPGAKSSIVSLQDVTQLREAQKRIVESEQRYHSIFDNTVEGIFQTTPEGKILTANKSTARIFGFNSPEEMISSVSSIGDDLYADPGDREKWKQIAAQKGEVKGFETSVNRKDGSTFWASFNARTVRDEQGSILYYEGTLEDITPRKLAEQELKNTLEKLRKLLAGTIQAMSLTVETRDPYTAGHQNRVSNLARSIACEMKLSSDTVDNIRMAGIIHDIGKISIPAELLAKPTRLTYMEMSLIKTHSQSGYDILKDVDLPHPIAEMVLQHHERLDGSGYPRGLKKDSILLETKILSVADVVEAIATHRPYRPALGVDVALEEIEKNKGILYDAEVVDICIRLFREKGFVFEQKKGLQS